MRFDQVVRDVPQLSRGLVWCTKCGRRQQVDSAAALRNGWPECCGYTMTIDSPEEREELRAKSCSGPAPRREAQP